MQAPQAPRPQTTFVPVRPMPSRSASTSMTRGSTVSGMRRAVDVELEGRGPGPTRRSPGRLRLERRRVAATAPTRLPRTRSRRVNPPRVSSLMSASWLADPSPPDHTSARERCFQPPAADVRRFFAGPRPGAGARGGESRGVACGSQEPAQALESLDRGLAARGSGSRPGGRAPSCAGPPRRGRPRPFAGRGSGRRDGRPSRTPAGRGAVVGAGRRRGLAEPAGELPAARRGDAVEVAAGSVAGAEDPEEHPAPAPEAGELGVDLGEPRAPERVELGADRARGRIRSAERRERRPSSTWGSDTRNYINIDIDGLGNRRGPRSGRVTVWGQKKGARRPPRNRVGSCKCLTYFFFLVAFFAFLAAFFFVAIMSPPSRQPIDSPRARC